MDSQGAVGDQHVVIFTLATSSYGIDISAVREIIRPLPLTRVPEAPPFVVGAINLRSSVVPVLDLRQRCGLPASEQGADTRIVVVNHGGQSLGLIVDRVSEVTTIPAEVIEPAVGLGSGGQAQQLLRGVARLEERLVVLLDLAQIVGEETREAACAPAVA